jgi:hypothetical protein
MYLLLLIAGGMLAMVSLMFDVAVAILFWSVVIMGTIFLLRTAGVL